MYLVGVDQRSSFNVHMVNGYGEPRAYGNRVETALAGNAALSGSAAWSGALLGFTPAGATLAGDAQIGVQLATLTGTRYSPRLAPSNRHDVALWRSRLHDSR